MIYIFTLLILAGCGNVYNEEIERAKELCGFHGGINYIKSASPIARCKDGDFVNLH